MREFQLGKLRYVIRYPEGFSEDKVYPVILYLHGAGTRGDDITKLHTNPYFLQIAKHKEFPFVTVAPLCTENTWFDLWEHLEQLVLQITKLPFADKDAIYLSGVSMGGYGSWQLAMSMPEPFAAMIPICGGGMYWNAGRLVDIPVWAFHGGKDTDVLPEESVKMVNAVNQFGGNARLTIYPENGHDAWTDTYSNYEVFQWLLQHRRKNTTDFCDKYNKADIYG